MKLLKVFVALVSTLGFGAQVHADSTYPNKPITIVVAYPPGGSADLIGRLMADKLSKRVGQPVVVENKAGASGNIGTSYVARSKPDGYTLLLNNNTLSMTTALGIQHAVDPLKDLTYIASVASTPVAIAVHPSIPANSVDELVEYAKTTKQELNYSSCGNGSPQHFAGEQFNRLAKTKMVHIPYGGCAPATLDGVAGQVSVLFNSIPNLDGLVQSKKLKYIAVASEKRLTFEPNLPAVKETKGFNEFAEEVWFGFLGPKDMPPEITKYLEREFLEIINDKNVQQELADRLISTYILNSNQFKTRMANELKKYTQVANELDMRGR